MIIFPAIDIKNGNCVRLTQGDYNKEEIFDTSPVNIAKDFAKYNFKYIHVVDLDGALNGQRLNSQIIKDMVNVSQAKVQVGGGIRNLIDIETVLSLGVERVIIGTSAIKDPNFAKDAIKKHGDKIAVSIDAKNGYVATDGWTKVTDIKACEFAKRLQDMGLKTLIYTDIAKDGMMAGPNYLQLEALQKSVTLDIIASGGVSSLNDLKNLANMNLYGAIVGKAIYTKAVTLKELESIQ